MVDLKKLKKLREETDVSYTICACTLKESGGDIDKAKKILLKQGARRITKKLNRQTDQGAIFSYLHHDNRVASLITLRCETDFVAKNKLFRDLGETLAMQVASLNPATVKELLAQKYIKDPTKTVDDLIKETILKLGENVKVAKYTRWEI